MTPTSREKEATEIRDLLRQATNGAGRLRLQVAHLLHQIHAERFWMDLQFPSFRAFVRAELPFGLVKAELLIDVHRKLVDELRVLPERLRDLEWSKVALVTSIITPGNVNELLRDVAQMSYYELRRKTRDMRKNANAESQPAARMTATAPVVSAAKTPPLPSNDWRRPRPLESQFSVPSDVWDQACYALHRRKSILLKGPSGSGKTELCYLLARTFERPIEPFNFGAMSEPRSALIGNTHFDREKGTWFQRSRFVRAVTTPGTLVLLDEISRAQREAFNILLTLLDTQGYLSLDEDQESSRVARAPGVVFLATANFGMEYTGADQLDNALAQRFSIHIPMEFPQPDKEASILTDRIPGLDMTTASRLTRFAAHQRQLSKEQEFITTVSTRMLIEAAEQVTEGVPLESAVRFCILNHFPEDGGAESERAKLLQILQKGC